MARERDPHAYPSISANELDAMYHEFTDFDAGGTGAQRFKELLDWTASVFEKLKAARGNKPKFRRLEVTAVMMYLQDITKSVLPELIKEFWIRSPTVS